MDTANEQTEELKNDLIRKCTTQIVSSYVTKNHVSKDDLLQVIVNVGKTVAVIADRGAATAEPEKPKPAVSIRKSITKSHIICLEDGLGFKSLKRHLKAKYDMSPDEYRAKWGLPDDYPMVSEEYRARRSAIAKGLGLGRKKGEKPKRKKKA